MRDFFEIIIFLLLQENYFENYCDNQLRGKKERRAHKSINRIGFLSALKEQLHNFVSSASDDY